MFEHSDMCTYTVLYVHIYICTYYSISSYKVNSVASLGHQAPSFGRVFFGCRLVAVRKMSQSATVCWFVVSKRLRLSILFSSNSLESSQRYGGGCASSSVFFCWECLFTFSDTLCAKNKMSTCGPSGRGMLSRNDREDTPLQITPLFPIIVCFLFTQWLIILLYSNYIHESKPGLICS